jgi:hypothetical protein
MRGSGSQEEELHFARVTLLAGTIGGAGSKLTALPGCSCDTLTWAAEVEIQPGVLGWSAIEFREQRARS